ncbi:MAG: MFS transporter [Deltaproteobacteria bacterium]|jgi:FHS family glucose/mannose:H+ symporter-like MFS transporter|nr:MFS transporter [Deltaproteobacteria bacterium]
MNYLIVVSYVSLFILGFSDNLRGPLFPEIIKYFHVNDTLGAAYFAVTSLVSFFASYYIRKRKDTYFLLQVLNLGVLAIGVSFLIQSFSQNFLVLILGVFFLGISFGFLGVSQNNLVIQGSKPHSRSRMLTGLHSMYGISSLLSPLFVASFGFLGWKNILLISSLLSFLFFVIVYYLNSKRKKMFREGQAQNNKEIHPHLQWKEKTICFVISLYVVAEIMLGTRLALFMRRYFDSSLEESSFYVTLMFVFMMIGRLIVSFYPPKWPLKIQLVGSLISSISFLILGMYLNPFFMVLCGFTMAPFYPLALSYISELNPQKSSEIVSTTIAIQALFVVLMHLGVGSIADLTSLKIAFWIGPICMMASLILLFKTKKEVYE